MKLLILFIVFGAFGIPHVRADILYSQAIHTTQTEEINTSTTGLVQTLGTGLTGTIYTVSRYTIGVDTGDGALPIAAYWRLYECDINYTNCQLKMNQSSTGGYENEYNSTKNYITSTGDPTSYTFNNTKYYYLWFDSNHKSSYQYGSATNTYNNGQCFRDNLTTACTGIADLYFVIQDNIGSTYTPEETGFVEVTPHNNEIIISPDVTFTAEWFITNSDIANMDSLFGWLNGDVRIQATIQDPLYTGWSCQIYTEDFDIDTLTTTFNYTFDGSNTLCPSADYNRDYKIIWRMVGTNGLNNMAWSNSTSTYFTVGTTEWEGNIETFVASSTQNAQAKRKHLAIDEGVCLPVFGDFNLSDCILLIVWPDPEFVSSELGEVSDKIQMVFPIGIITDFRRIISTTTVGTLTIIDATLPSALGIGTPNITLDLNGVLDEFLNATTSEFNNESATSTATLYEITNYYWTILCYIGFTLYLIRRILGERFALSNTKKL